jgi:glycerol-3-phosphate dehydrogenase (NAD(P)+)
MPQATTPLAVLGAGSWGTALAIQFARAGHPTRLWGRDAAQQASMAAARCNTRYLPQAKFPDALIVVDRLEDAVAGVNDILIAVPSHALRSVLIELAPLLSSSARLAWATKGFELDTGLLPHQVAKEILGTDRPFAVLSGPTFAQEVGQGLPTAMTIASACRPIISAPTLRATSSVSKSAVRSRTCWRSVPASPTGWVSVPTLAWRSSPAVSLK